MTKLLFNSVSWFLILWFPLFTIIPVFAQDDDIMSETYFYDDSDEEEEEAEETPKEEVAPEEEKIEERTPEPVVVPEKESAPVEEDVFKSEYDYSSEPQVENPPETQIAKKDNKKSLIQNAVIEGIQLSSEPGEKENESIVSCYFIFRDKPTSYFYESKVKDKLIIFEFNDVQLGSSPVPSAELTPVQKFKIRQEKIDANKDIVGLRPEWHDVVKVTFYLDDVPLISVKDEYSVISFSFKWSSNPDDNEGNVAAAGGLRHPGWFWTSIGAGVAAIGGIGAYLYLNQDDDDTTEVFGPIDISDIPIHTDGN